MSSQTFVCSLLLASLTMVVMPAAAHNEPPRLTLEDLLSVEPLGETPLSPDGKNFAFIHNGQIALLPVEGGWPVSLTSLAGGKSGLSWSPDGKALAFVSQGSIWTVSTTGGQPRRLTHAAPGSGDPRQAADRSPHWSPKGDWILFETGRRGHNDLAVVSPDGLSENIITAGNADAGEGVWSPDGSEIAYVERSPAYFSGKLQIAKFDEQSGRVRGSVNLYTSPVDRGGGWSLRKPAWSPDGRTLAVVLQESGWDNVYLIPAAGGTPKPLTRGEQDDLDPVFSPDGKSLAIVSNRQTPEESHIWIVPVDGSGSRELTHFKVPGVESAPEWSPDGHSIYFHRSSPLESADLVAVDTGTKAAGEPRYLTHTTPKYMDGALQVPELVRKRKSNPIYRATWKA